mmetsp:Transcript_6763/g.7693  ORF Transcript_6763/g.7693 Transcript_6763/m.7693 type:complete len:190 (-) Transcript_6763:97-666(-)|eukprot:CAMPEP_0168321672 /NCGR_PEP_ID=MMETSP0213-20121227/2423_1 /TAXON_ID=151035 /ORGANISM="Euplotes harpa, Strain FSP1.4" /LENGTH=189 /DNA_ID=CAMNT_0008323393 /DNA_START=464 /DNA_END=1033 /DNA_ORIENTATION=+
MPNIECHQKAHELVSEADYSNTLEQKQISDESGSVSVNNQSSTSDKLQLLLKRLRKTKGVDQTQIDEHLLEKTSELGQKKVAELLNIPYRRYKSILGRAGIKSCAGRKIKDTSFETKVVNWALQVKAANKILTRKMIKDNATVTVGKLIAQGNSSLKKLSLSKGWLDKFVKRHPEIGEYLTSQKGKRSQ